jgi:hypothetical protein
VIQSHGYGASPEMAGQNLMDLFFFFRKVLICKKNKPTEKILGVFKNYELEIKNKNIKKIKLKQNNMHKKKKIKETTTQKPIVVPKI